MRYTKDEKQQLARKYGLTFQNIGAIIGWNNKVFDGKKSLDNIDWIKGQRKVIIDFYEDQVKNGKLKQSTLRKVYATLAKVFRTAIPDERLYKKYSDKNWSMSAEESKEQVKQKLKPDEKFIPYDNIVDLRRAYLDSWNADLHNKELNIKTLILALNTYQPPLRSEVRDMKLYDGKPNVMNENYVFKRDGYWYYWIGKSIKIHKLIHYEQKFPRKLSKVLDKSLTYFPRLYLLTKWDSDGMKPLPSATYSNFLSSLGLSITALRKAYVTKLYNTSISFEEKNKLAEQMRNSVNVAERYYMKKNADQSHLQKKIDGMNKQLEEIAEDEPEEQPIDLIDEPREKPGPKSKFKNHTEYMRVYRTLNKNKLKDDRRKRYEDEDYNIKQRARVYVYKLNLPKGHKNHIGIPSDDMKEFYKLKQVDGKWKTEL
jgi:hypothetical protein